MSNAPVRYGDGISPAPSTLFPVTKYTTWGLRHKKFIVTKMEVATHANSANASETDEDDHNIGAVRLTPIILPHLAVSSHQLLSSHLHWREISNEQSSCKMQRTNTP